MVTMVFMRQIILRFPHIMPIYWTSTPPFFLADPCFWANTPGLEFRENSRERAARSPTNRSQRFDTPSPGTRVCTQAMRLWLPPAPSSTVHTHSNEDIQQPTASLHTARQQPGNSSVPTAPGFGSHATRSLFFSTKARRFAHVWRVHALRCGRRATLQLSDTSQRSPKFAQILPGQTVLNLPSITISPMPQPAQ